MHAKHPDWRIAVSFNTRSLYQTIRDSIRRFYADFGGEEPNWDRLEVLHGWGGKSEHGMYYKVSQSAGRTPRTVGTAKDAFGDGSPDELLEACCRELVEDAPIQEEYDAILIDEAQDMEPAFYQMLPSAPAAETTDLAYDEAQNLTSLGTEPEERVRRRRQRRAERRFEWNLSRWYPEESDHAEILPNALLVLMLAHAFGMG